MARTFRLLLLEDDPPSASWFQLALQRAAEGTPFRFHVVSTPMLRDALRMLDEGGYDLLAADLNVPDSRGVETVRRLRERTTLPLVVVSGVSEDAAALEAIRMGAQEYLLKDGASGKRILRAVLFALLRGGVDLGSEAAPALFDPSGQLV